MTDNSKEKEFIKEWFSEKGMHPGDAATLASQLKLNELELYTKTERFIFELLQNADDMPIYKNAKGILEVNVIIEMTENFLLFIHNGKPFDEEDVMSISDAAQSTKKKDITKIGYKGIGFKSVFTDSKTVFIKSANFSFKFDKTAEIYKNFWELYKTHYEEKHEKAKEKFRNRYKNRETEFEDINKIPWQIKPIWVNKYPEELNDTNFKAQHNVAIALLIEKDIFERKDYNGKILNLFKEPRFLLFLKHIAKINLTLKDISKTINLEKKENELQVTLNGSTYNYSKSNYHINISDEEFQKADINIKLQEDNDKIFFVDKNGRKIDTIPERLSNITQTTISFAAQLKDKSIEILKKEDAILFNYLPTSDSRFEFNFLINADFITKTDREFIQVENQWNEFLFYHIGYFHLDWISKLADNELYRKSYLRLLKDDFFTDEPKQLEFKPLFLAFNKGYKKAINEIPFVINEKGQKSLINKIIIDNTGISEVSKNLFYFLFGTEKLLIHPDINNYLSLSIKKRKYLELEQVSFNDFIENVKGKILKFIIKIVKFKEKQYEELIKWLNTALKETDNNDKIINSEIENLPLLRFINKKGLQKHKSWKNSISDNNYITLTGSTYGLKNILLDLDFFVSVINIDDFSSLKQKISVSNTYIEDDYRLFVLLNSKLISNTLSAERKSSIFNFINNLELEEKKKLIQDELCLFSNISEIEILKNLISSKINIKYNFLQQFIILKKEEVSCKSIDKYLINETNLYSRLFGNSENLKNIVENIDTNNDKNIDDLYDCIIYFYEKDENSEKKIIDDSAIYFLHKESGFVLKDKFFFNSEIIDFVSSNKSIDIVKYDNLKYAIEKVISEPMPNSATLNFIKYFGIDFSGNKVVDKINDDINMQFEHLETLILYLIKSTQKEPLFEKTYIKKETDKSYSIIVSDKIQYFSVNSDLKSYVQDIEILQLLPKELNIENIHKLQLFDDNMTIDYIIKNFKFDINFSKIMYSNSSKVSNWFKKLTDDTIIRFNTQDKYNSNSCEFYFIKILLDIKDDISNIRNKILIDNKFTIDELTYTEDIIFSFKEPKEFFKLKLSEILPKYKDKSLIYDKLLKSFPKDIRQSLQDNIFQAKRMKNAEILFDLKNEIKTTNILNVTQLAFVALYLKDDTNLWETDDKIKQFKIVAKRNRTIKNETLLGNRNTFYLKNKKFIADGNILHTKYEKLKTLLHLKPKQTKTFGKLNFRIEPFINENGEFLASPYLLNIDENHEAQLNLFINLFKLWQKLPNKDINISFEPATWTLPDKSKKTFGENPSDFIDFAPTEKIYPSEFAYRNENVPNKQLNILKYEQKWKDEVLIKQFLTSLGVKTEKTEVINLRKLLTNGNKKS